MKNVKAIELTRPTFGLPKGTVLSRLSGNEPFAYKSEHVGENYQFSNSLSISQAAISWDFAKPIEWFEERRRSAKHVIQELEAEIERLKASNEKLTADIASVIDSYDSASKELNKLKSRAIEKRDEFQKKMNELQLDLENDIIAGESTEWADEAMTVYYNLVDLINKLLA
jgi:chromosome segregation ATPase